MKPAKELVQEFIALQRGYASTPRAMVTRERYRNVFQSGLIKDLDLDSEALREPLIEHVGSIPILASFLYPYIEHAQEIDLGRTLIMVSVHDIGETKLGDVLTYKKTNKEEDEEMAMAQTLLHSHFYPYLEEMEKRETFDAKFAKAVDALAPIIHELDLPEVTVQRFKHWGFNVEDIKRKKTMLFEWDHVMRGIFDFCVCELDGLSKQEK